MTKQLTANLFTGGDSVIKRYHLMPKWWQNANVEGNHSAKYKTMIDCLRQPDSQQEDEWCQARVNSQQMDGEPLQGCVEKVKRWEKILSNAGWREQGAVHDR